MKSTQKNLKFCFDLHPKKAKSFRESCMTGLSLEVKFISVQKNMLKYYVSIQEKIGICSEAFFFFHFS